VPRSAVVLESRFGGGTVLTVAFSVCVRDVCTHTTQMVSRSAAAVGVIICSVVLLRGVAAAACASCRDPRSILLRAETINVHTAAAAGPDKATFLRRSGSRNGEAEAEERTYLVHMDDAGNHKQRQAVREAADQKLDRYVPHNTFLLDLSPTALQRVRALIGSSVLWIGELQPHHKLAAAEIHKLDEELHAFVQAAQRTAESAAGAQAVGAQSTVATPSAVLVAKLRAPKATALAGSFQQQLQNHGFAVSVTAATSRKLHVRRLADSAAGGGAAKRWAAAVGEWLSEQLDVQWVEPKARVKVRNKYAAMTVQGGFVDGSRPCQPCMPTMPTCPACSRGGRTPIWEMGLKGEGEIVGCGDTGVDVDSCFFWDSNVANGRPGPALAPDVSLVHRKIVSYKAGGGTGTGDASDDVRGHGTHVVGSIAGSLDSSFSPGDDVPEHSGMAPAAKIAFFDLDSGLGLDIPDDLVQDYYGWAHSAGARIHSNSWGDDSNGYTLLTAETDQFVYENAEMLVLFAAGNDGDSDPPDHTVGAPATCKNCLCVGASQSDERDALKDGGRLMVYVEAEGAQGAPAITGMYMATSAAFGPKVQENGGEVSLASYLGELCDLANVTSIQGLNLLAVVDRGTCTFTTKVRNAQELGAVGVVVANNVEGDPISLGGDDGDGITIPSVMISKEDGAAMYNMTRDAPGQKLNVELTEARALPSFHQDNLAGFSSLGPTSDGRLKPDIVAPGQDIHSAFSDGQPYSYQCSSDGKSDRAALTRMSGTSMATPIVAGAAALARQYFRTGKYAEVAGSAGSWMEQAGGNGFVPSAALLRAVLINGAQDLSLYGGRRGSKGALLKPAPSMEMGFGRLNLAKSLRVPEQPSSPALIVLDAASQTIASTTAAAVVEHGQIRRHCFKVGTRASGAPMPLKITLAWTDPPAQPHSALALVHDLDLAVFHQQSGRIEYGNHRLRGAARRSRGDEEEAEPTDTLNPTEQVVLDLPVPNSVYLVYVMGTRVVRSRYDGEEGSGADSSAADGGYIIGTQDYALAITGDGLEALAQDSSECLAVTCPEDRSGDTVQTCSGRGQCEGGTCVCQGAYWGVNCEFRKACPKGEGGLVCSNHGTCDLDKAMCLCEDGWSGAACQEYSCASGSVANMSVSTGETLVVESCSSGAEYRARAACAWQIQPAGSVSPSASAARGLTGSAYLLASLQRLEIESSGYFFPLWPGCTGEADCAQECPYDALHVVKGLLEPRAGGGFSSNEMGEPCHGWALAQRGYVGTYCGTLQDLTDAKMIALPSTERGEALSLIFCSDTAVQPGDGFAISVAAVACPHNCSGHGSCAEGRRAQMSEPQCTCEEGWGGDLCNLRSMHCDPSQVGGDNISASVGRGMYQCVKTLASVGAAGAGLGNGIGSRAQGLYVCAPGYSGEECDQPFCSGEVNVSWVAADIASHDRNASATYPNSASCQWNYDVSALASGEQALLNISHLDLEYHLDYLEIACADASPSEGEPAAANQVLARFTGNAPCPLWPSCVVQDAPGEQGCQGTERRWAAAAAEGQCLVQREWSWVALQVHRGECSLLSVTFSSDASKSASGFQARISRVEHKLLRPFVEATITVFNHTIADMDNKTRGVLAAVARAARVPERDVVMTHAVGHMNTWSQAGEEEAAATATAATDKRMGRRPVDEENEHAHMHVTVTIQVLAHKTDAPEAGVWALYHRLAFNANLPNSTAATVDSGNTTGAARGAARGVAGAVWAEGAAPSHLESVAAEVSGEGLAGGKARRSSVDDTLWVWGLGEDDIGGVWRESDGEGCAVIEALKAADLGISEVSLRLLRVSVSGDELPVLLAGLWG